MKKTDPPGESSSSAPASSGPREAIAPPIADHRAIERVELSRPKGGDQRQGGRVGHAGCDAAQHAGRKENANRWREAGKQGGGDR